MFMSIIYWLNSYMKDLSNMVGQLLVAIPNTAHTAYVRGVMLVTAHWPAGSASCLINKPLNNQQTVTTIMRNAGIDARSDEPIFYGGPDETNRVQFIHTLDWQCASTKKITPGIGLTQELSILAAVARGQGPQYWRCIAGHRLLTNSPGLPDCIEGEISGMPPWNMGHRWLSLPATVANVFGSVGDEQWLEAVNESSRLEVDSWFNHARN
jgi:putative transcriptional regulator